MINLEAEQFLQELANLCLQYNVIRLSAVNSGDIELVLQGRFPDTRFSYREGGGISAYPHPLSIKKIIPK